MNVAPESLTVPVDRPPGDARATGSRLVSIDDALDGFGVERVWD